MKNKSISIPLWLTWFRIAIVPVFIALFYLPEFGYSQLMMNIINCCLFCLAAFTDYLDGYLARRWNQESSFGAFLDPVADKAIVAASLIILVDDHRTFAVFAIIIILREIGISALREWMAQVGQKSSVAVAYIGKLKTAAQFFAIAFLVLDYHTRLIGNILMVVAVILTVVSMFYYLKQAKNFINN